MGCISYVVIQRGVVKVGEEKDEFSLWKRRAGRVSGLVMVDSCQGEIETGLHGGLVPGRD